MEISDKEISSREELNDVLSTIKRYCKADFDFYLAWTIDDPVVPDRIKMPTYGIMSVKEIDYRTRELFSTKDSKKTREYRELRFADRFYSYIRRLNVGDRTRLFGASFVDEADVEQCRERYSDTGVFS